MSVPLVVLLLASLAVMGTASLATAKDDARARLAKPLPFGAHPGAMISVEWAVRVPDERLGVVPFGAGNMFVRLLSKTRPVLPRRSASPTRTGMASTGHG